VHHGVTLLIGILTAKRLELLTEIAPAAAIQSHSRRILALSNIKNLRRRSS
jgi:hypothetical protein